jgi:hypothetical protein
MTTLRDATIKINSHDVPRLPAFYEGLGFRATAPIPEHDSRRSHEVPSHFLWHQ